MTGVRLEIPGFCAGGSLRIVIHSGRNGLTTFFNGRSAWNRLRLNAQGIALISPWTSKSSWVREKLTTLSRQADTAKAFNYLMNHWRALCYYSTDGWAEIDNNIAENALRTVSPGRKIIFLWAPIAVASGWR